MNSVTSIEEILERIQERLLQLEDKSQPSSKVKHPEVLTVEQFEGEFQRLLIEQESDIKNKDFQPDLQPNQIHQEMDSEFEQERLKGNRLRTEIRSLIDMIQEFVEI